MFWGYSLAYSRTANAFIGDLANFGMKNVVAAPSPGSVLLPEIVFCLYQMLFCICTVVLVIGGSFERGRILPSMIFAFCWATIVYCPIACWTWNSNGWLYKLPSLDFAGGGPVHIASGWYVLQLYLALANMRLTLIGLLLHMHSSSASAPTRARRSTASRTTRPSSSLAPASSGSAGSASTVVPPSTHRSVP